MGPLPSNSGGGGGAIPVRHSGGGGPSGRVSETKHQTPNRMSNAAVRPIYRGSFFLMSGARKKWWIRAKISNGSSVFIYKPVYKNTFFFYIFMLAFAEELAAFAE
ncbi:MAG: hypothetical protein IKZ72_04580 [Bacteroidales bacterium]|nr:hypothetical protein [Bacteroidales bacterium]